MFDFVRKHTKLMQFLLFLLIFPSFVLFGVEGYSRMRDRGEAVAEVGGKTIQQDEWDFAQKQEIDRIRARAPNIDIKLLDTPEAKYRTLERMVRERTLITAADKARLSVSDARLARTLEADPTIAGLRRADGTLDMPRYRQLLASQGMSPEMFEAKVRSDLAAGQVLTPIADTGLSGTSVADRNLAAYYEKRSIQVALFKPADFAAKLNPSAAELEAFYQAKPKLFQAPEEAKIEYVVLDLDSVVKGIVPAEADLKTYYEQNTANLAGQEQRRASHILITAAKSSDDAQRAAAKAKADALLEQVKKAPNTFADVARKNSQDPGSAAAGGDLDFFGRGAMVKPFEEAVFKLKVGDISDVVESDFGYHIIKLTDIKSPKPKSFEEMRPELEATVKKQLAQRKYAEAAESFANSVYEQSDSLQPAADKLKLRVQTATGVARQPAAGTKGVLANPKFLSALFASDSVEKKRNTEAVEVGANQMVSGRIVEYSPVRVLPFDAVKDKVRQLYLADKGAELARKEGEAKLAAWKANAAAASYPAAVTVSRVDGQNTPMRVIEAALRTDATALPVQIGVDLQASGYAVVRVLKSLPWQAPPEAQAVQERQQYTRQWATTESQAYLDWLKAELGAKILTRKPESDAAP